MRATWHPIEWARRSSSSALVNPGKAFVDRLERSTNADIAEDLEVLVFFSKTRLEKD